VLFYKYKFGENNTTTTSRKVNQSVRSEKGGDSAFIAIF